MARKDLKSLKEMTNETLINKLNELRLELQIQTRKITASSVPTKNFKKRELRRDIARILTLLRSRGVKA